MGLAVATLALNIVIGQQPGLLAWPFLVAAVIFALFAWWLYQVDGAERALLRAAAASILLSWALFGATFPSLPRLFPANDLSKYVRFAAGCADPQVATAGYHEPSLVFLTGTGLKHADGAGGGRIPQARRVPLRLHRKPPGTLVRAARRRDRLALRQGPRVEGINISGGRQITVTVYRTEPNP